MSSKIKFFAIFFSVHFNTINDEIEERELYDMGEGIELENISGNAEYKKVEESLSTLLIDFRNQKYMVK